MDQTSSDKPAKRPGKGGTVLPDTPNPFSKDYQPTPEQKREGWMKKKKGHELARAVLELAFQGLKDSELKKKAAIYFGVEDSQITVEMMLHFRQAEKAIQKADTNAYREIMNRAFGLPKQPIETDQNINITFQDDPDL